MSNAIAEVPCAKCAQPIGDKRWKMVEGRVYHEGCKPTPPPKTKRQPGRGLGAKAERSARNALHGRGQQTLEEDRG